MKQSMIKEKIIAFGYHFLVSLDKDADVIDTIFVKNTIKMIK
ncbi:hypothetical protein ACGTJS_01295 [Faucicola mancuniensis]